MLASKNLSGQAKNAIFIILGVIFRIKRQLLPQLKTCYMYLQFALVIADTDGFTCEFESEDYCGWTNSNSDHFDWVRNYGAADVRKRTGPASGAGGAGSYMLADTSNSQSGVGKRAQLVSPKLNTNGESTST